MIPPQIAAAVLGATAVVSFAAGWTANGWRYEAKAAATLRAQAKATAADAAHKNTISAGYEEGKANGEQVAEQRASTVRTIYRTIEVPGACEPPADALRVLDAAIAGPGAATGEPVSILPPNYTAP